jgi:hypothetical protein
MEQPKIAKLENAARRYREAIKIRLAASGDEKNKHAKLRELMHEHCGTNVKTEGGKTYLVYHRPGVMIVKLNITEKAKVIMGDEMEDEDDESIGGEGEAEAEDIEVADDAE